MKNRFLGLFATTILFATPVWAAVPYTFTYHGVLRDNDSLVNGEHSISSKIVNESDVEIAMASEQNIMINSGHYQLDIKIDEGSVQKVADADKLFLMIAVDGNWLSPKLEINSVPYAIATQTASSLKTSSVNGAGKFSYKKMDKILYQLPAEDEKACPCDVDKTKWDCDESFEHLTFNEEECYDVGGEAYSYYSKQKIIRPLEVVAIESGSVGIGTSQPQVPLHILSDSAENSEADVIVAGPNPTILLDDFSNKQVALNAKEGLLNISGGIDAEYLGEKLQRIILDKMYPVGSVYLTLNTELDTADKISATIGGKWQRLEDDYFLESASKQIGAKVEAGLPNIKGKAELNAPASTLTSSNQRLQNGALASYIAQTSNLYSYYNGVYYGGSVDFDASKYNKIYSDDVTTVQPKAIRVLMYKRVE